MKNLAQVTGLFTLFFLGNMGVDANAQSTIYMIQIPDPYSDISALDFESAFLISHELELEDLSKIYTSDHPFSIQVAETIQQTFPCTIVINPLLRLDDSESLRKKQGALKKAMRQEFKKREENTCITLVHQSLMKAAFKKDLPCFSFIKITLSSEELRIQIPGEPEKILRIPSKELD